MTDEREYLPDGSEFQTEGAGSDAETGGSKEVVRTQNEVVINV